MQQRKWGLQTERSLPRFEGNDGLGDWGVAPELTIPSRAEYSQGGWTPRLTPSNSRPFWLSG